MKTHVILPDATKIVPLSVGVYEVRVTAQNRINSATGVHTFHVQLAPQNLIIDVEP